MRFPSISLCALVALTLQAQAGVTISLTFGIANDSSGVGVADGTLWALVADGDNDGFIAGLDLSNPTDSIANSGTAETYFTSGMSLSLGTTIGSGGDQVFAMGAMDSSTTTVASSHTLVINNFTYGDFNVDSGEKYMVLWFPGATYTGGGSESIDSQVGGVHTSTVDSFGDAGMVMPSDGFTESHYARSTDFFGGPLSTTHFNAVVVPEPTAWLLTGLGSLLLLRRRR